MAEVAIKAQIAAVKEVMVNYYRLSKDDTMDEKAGKGTQTAKTADDGVRKISTGNLLLDSTAQLSLP